MSHTTLQTSSASLVGEPGVFRSRLLNFLVGQWPSAQEERGNRLLEDAHTVITANAAILSPSDLGVARERITHAEEIRIGSDSKSFFSKYLQLREYNKSAKDALLFAKTISERAILAQSSVAALADTSINARLRAEIKPRIATLVQSMYLFDRSQTHASIVCNVKLVQTLLTEMNFVYPEIKDSGKCRDRYRHPIIQGAINITWFCDKDDVGVVNHRDSSLMPISVIALTLTVIECCIEEWSDGTRRESSWDDKKFQDVYNLHVSSFQVYSLANKDLLDQLRCDLLKNAREHASVPPIIGSRRSLGRAGDAVGEEGSQSSSPFPPTQDGIPGIPRIIVEAV